MSSGERQNVSVSVSETLIHQPLHLTLTLHLRSAATFTFLAISLDSQAELLVGMTLLSSSSVGSLQHPSQLDALLTHADFWISADMLDGE